jgi:hypothetical protein
MKIPMLFFQDPYLFPNISSPRSFAFGRCASDGKSTPLVCLTAPLLLPSSDASILDQQRGDIV